MEIVFKKDTNIDRLLANRSTQVRRRMHDFLQQTMRSMLSAYAYRHEVKFTWLEWGFNYKQRNDLLSFLNINELIDNYSKGFKFSEDAKKESQLYPNSRMFDSFTLKEDNIETITKIRFDNQKEKKINDKDSKFLKKYSKSLYGRTNIPIINMSRIYSKDNNSGGRIYSTYQSIPAIIRSEMFSIDNQNVVEMDYKNNHISIIMSMLDNRVDNDLYSIFDEYELKRNMIKRAVSVMLNATRPVQAFMSPYGKFNWSREFSEMFVESFFQKFELLKNLRLGRDLGMYLQKFEGDVIMDILEHAHHKKQIVLPVHDSIICKKEDVYEYTKTMKDVWCSNIERNKYVFKERFIKS